MKKTNLKWLTRYREHLETRTNLNDSTINQKILNLRRASIWFLDNSMIVQDRNADKLRDYGPMSALIGKAVFAYMTYLLEEGRTIDTRQKIKRDIGDYITFITDVELVFATMPDMDFFMKSSGSEGAGAKDQITKSTMQHISVELGGMENRRDATVIECLSLLGLRCHELLALTFDDFERDVVNIRSTKTKGKSRYGGDRVMLATGDIHLRVSIYRANAEIQSSDLLFPVGRQAIYDLVKKFGKEIGLPWLSPHKFRHYCITRFASVTEEGFSTPVFTVAELSKMFGVSPEEIVKTYMHPEIEDMVDKAKNLGSIV